jgi:hypothetical protein
VRREQVIVEQQERLLNKVTQVAEVTGSSDKTVTLQLETPEEVVAARRLAREGRAMVTGNVAVFSARDASAL